MRALAITPFFLSLAMACAAAPPRVATCPAASPAVATAKEPAIRNLLFTLFVHGSTAASPSPGERVLFEKVRALLAG